MRLIPVVHRGRDDERGSAMIIVITVIAMATLLSVAVVSRTSNGLDSARQNQDYAGALANADAGVSDALFRVDQFGTGSPSSFCVGAGCTVAAVPGAPGVEYRVDVDPLDGNTVTVKSRGLANGVPHAVRAELVRQRELPFAIFANSAAAFRGNVDGPSCTQAAMPCQGVYYVDDQEPPNVLTTRDAAVGTTGTLRCTGTGSPADEFATYPGGTNNGCPNHTVLSGEYDPQDPITGPCPPPVASPPTPCRDAATYTTLTAEQCANQSGAIPPGRYFCATDLVFKMSGTIPVTLGPGTSNGGKVEYFVIPATGTADVVLDSAFVNVGGDPTKLRINLAGAGELEGGNGGHAGTITGIVYAPSATSTNNGCKINVRGALVINDYTCNGAPHLQVQYDARIATLQQSNWTLRNFEEIPSGDVDIP